LIIKIAHCFITFAIRIIYWQSKFNIANKLRRLRLSMAVQVVSYLLLMNIILQQTVFYSYMKNEQLDMDVEKILPNFPTRLGRIKSYGKRPWPLIKQDSIGKRQSSSHLGDNLLHSVSLLDHMMKWERTTRQLERMRSDDGPFRFSFTPNPPFNDNQ
ncbi:hypothetical protein D917_07196, partial [Trichinella nativa]